MEVACEARDIYYDQCHKSSCDHTDDGRILKHRPILVAASVGSYGAYLADGSEYRLVIQFWLWYASFPMVYKYTM